MMAYTAKRIVLGILLILLLSLLCSITQGAVPEIGQHPYVFEHFLEGMKITAHINYLLFLPKSYGSDPRQKWPLIMFFHGAGEMGDNVELLKIHGIPKIVGQKDDFPFIGLSPQIPLSGKAPWVGNESATGEIFTALLDQITATYAVDTNRIYLTGLSIGGWLTWGMAVLYPERFAAIAPICGARSYPDKACVLKDIPVWAFHGAKDTTVSISVSENMVKALEDCGGNVKFTVYPDAGHDAWTVTYNNPELYDWFLQHSLQPMTTGLQSNNKLPTLWGKVKAEY
jgi:predicted peptidase